METYNKFLTTSKYKKQFNYLNKKRKLLATDGKVKERIEISFYSCNLKSFETYTKIISQLVPINKSWFYDVSFEEFFDLLLKNEQKSGRAMFI